MGFPSIPLGRKHVTSLNGSGDICKRWYNSLSLSVTVPCTSSICKRSVHALKTMIATPFFWIKFWARNAIKRVSRTFSSSLRFLTH